MAFIESHYSPAALIAKLPTVHAVHGLLDACMLTWPERVVCLTEETTETLYLLNEEHRIAGISGFTVRPPRARKEKPKVSAFTSAKIDKILALKPDLVLGFSDLQADIARELIGHGIPVHVFNQRSVDEILTTIATIGALVGAAQKAAELAATLSKRIETMRSLTSRYQRRPKVYFEEWDDPQISAIQWVSELVSIAGGDDCFPHLATESLGKNRIIADPLEVVRSAPDIIIGSWCGKKFRSNLVAEREGWRDVPAVKHQQLFEIKSANILQPGPAALTDGLDQLHEIISAWVATHSN